MFKVNDEVILKDIPKKTLVYNNYFNEEHADKIKRNYTKGHLVVHGTYTITKRFNNVTLYDAIFDKNNQYVYGLIEDRSDFRGRPFEEIKDRLNYWGFNSNQINYFEHAYVQLNEEAFENFLE